MVARHNVVYLLHPTLEGVLHMVVSRTPNMTDYEAERRSFHLDVPEYFNFATDVIGKWANDPNKLAMLWIGQNGEERHLTFAYFAERSSRAANAFAKLGINKGDRYPKMVLHTHASYPIGHTIIGKYWLDLHEDDLHWNLSEMGWANYQN